MLFKGIQLKVHVCTIFHCTSVPPKILQVMCIVYYCNSEILQDILGFQDILSFLLPNICHVHAIYIRKVFNEL